MLFYCQHEDIIRNDFLPNKHSTNRASSFQNTWGKLLCLFCCNSEHEAALIGSVEFGSFKICQRKWNTPTLNISHFSQRNEPFKNFLKWNLNNLNIWFLFPTYIIRQKTNSTNIRCSFLYMVMKACSILWCFMINKLLSDLSAPLC